MADLSRESYVSLGTFRKDGREVLTPVWFAADADDAKRLWIIPNDGDLAALRRKAEAVWQELAALA
mgnify:CR=1 FL=1